MKKTIVSVFMMLCLLGGASGQAAVTLYTSQAAYLAAVGAQPPTSTLPDPRQPPSEAAVSALRSRSAPATSDWQVAVPACFITAMAPPIPGNEVFDRIWQRFQK